MDRATFEHILKRRAGRSQLLTGGAIVAGVGSTGISLRGTQTVAGEFAVTAITSQGDLTSYSDYYGPIIPWNPHIKFFQDRRGYQTVAPTPELWRTDLKMVSTVTSQEASIETVASYVVEDGQPGPVTG